MQQDKYAARATRFWTRRADHWDGLYESESSFDRWFNRVFRKAIFMRVDMAQEVLSRTSSRTVLDIGCGSGRPACQIARSEIDSITGIDITPEMINLAKQLSEKHSVQNKCSFRVSHFEEDQFDEHYDSVIALGVLEYVDHPVEFIRKMRDISRKAIFFSIPRPTLVRSPLRKIRYTLRGCSIHFYSRSAIRKMMLDAGFTEDKMEIRPLTRAGYGVTGYKELTENRRGILKE